MTWRCPDCGMTSHAKVHKAHLYKRHLLHYKKLSETDATWLAGALDFEGSLTVGKYNIKERFCWVILFQLCGTHEVLVRKVREIIGEGNICRCKAQTSKSSNYWRYTLHSNGLRNVLPQLIPYLLSKNKQVELTLEALSLTLHNRGIGDHSKNHTRLSEIQSEIKYLNRRGEPICYTV
jgi:hypothetical protein